MVSANRLMTMAAGLCLAGVTPHGLALETETPTLLAPQLCRQLGGPLACQLARPGPWAYKVGDAVYGSEAKAYEHMLDVHGPTSVFALAYRWGKVNPDPGAPEQARTIETMSWKMYYRECSGHADGPCEEFPRYTGYQRMREIACPAGYRFTSDASSPYCLPVDAARALAQTASGAGGMIATRATGAPARPALPR